MRLISKVVKDGSLQSAWDRITWSVKNIELVMWRLITNSWPRITIFWPTICYLRCTQPTFNQLRRKWWVFTQEMVILTLWISGNRATLSHQSNTITVFGNHSWLNMPCHMDSTLLRSLNTVVPSITDWQSVNTIVHTSGIVLRLAAKLSKTLCTLKL